MQQVMFTAALFFLTPCINAQTAASRQDQSAQHSSLLLQRPVNEVFYNGYVITIQQAIAGTYGYDIRKEGQLLFSQRKNPFNNSLIGLKSKDDVFKIARWQIDRVGTDSRAASFFKIHLPKKVAQQLNIRIH
jgi:hypothetical protein